MSRTALIVGLALTAVGSPAAADTASAMALREFFAAIGGRDVWSEGHGEYVLAKIRNPGFPLPATFEFCWSWDGPQAADRMRVQGLTQLRAHTGAEGWTYEKPSGRSAGTLNVWDDARMRRGRAEWRGNFEVLTHRLARQDPRVTTRMGEGLWRGWIEISVDDQVVAHLLTDETGAPKKFHRVFDEISVVFGPLAERGALNFPAWGAFEGAEPFDLIAFEILDAAPTKPFRKPGPNDPGDLSCR